MNTSRREQARKVLEELMEAQANDEGLLFIPQTAPEAYLQTAIIALHVAVEQYLRATK